MNNKLDTYGHPTNFKVLDKRKYCTESRLKFQSDVQIPVPWGQMSGKINANIYISYTNLTDD